MVSCHRFVRTLTSKCTHVHIGGRRTIRRHGGCGGGGGGGGDQRHQRAEMTVPIIDGVRYLSFVAGGKRGGIHGSSSIQQTCTIGPR